LAISIVNLIKLRFHQISSDKWNYSEVGTGPSVPKKGSIDINTSF